MVAWMQLTTARAKLVFAAVLPPMLPYVTDCHDLSLLTISQFSFIYKTKDFYALLQKLMAHSDVFRMTSLSFRVGTRFAFGRRLLEQSLRL